MHLQLGKIYDNVSFQNVLANEVLVAAGRVRACKELRVITGNSKTGLCARNWFQEAIPAKIKKSVAIDIDFVFSCYPYPTFKVGCCAAEIPDSREPRVIRGEVRRP